MAIFKVGDKVKYVSGNHGWEKDNPKDTVGTIREFWDDLILVDWSNGDWNHYLPEDLELITDYQQRLAIEAARRYLEQWHEPEIKKQSLINKTMNAFKKAMLDADTKTLIKAGYLDDESLDLTTAGREQLMFILFEANKKALVDAAKAEIKEQEAKK